MSEWFVFIPIVICPFILEVLWRSSEKKSFHIYLFNHLLDSISNLSGEIISDNTGKKLCGFAVAIEVVSLIVILLIVVISNLFHHDLLLTLIFLSLLIFLPVPILMGSFCINHWFIAFKAKYL
jgi:uncharacterized membrane protein